MEELLIKFCNFENQCKIGGRAVPTIFWRCRCFRPRLPLHCGWRHNEQELGGTFPPSFGASGSRGVTHKQGNTKKTKMQKCKNEPELKATFPLSFGAWSKREVRQKQEMQNDKTSN